MKKLFKILFLVFSIPTFVLQAQDADTNLLKQLAMCGDPSQSVTPRFSSLGGANPAFVQDVGGFGGSPTAQSHLLSLQSSASYSELMCKRGSRNFNFAFPSKLKLPLDDVTIGFLFQSDVFRDTSLLSNLRNQAVVGVGITASPPVKVPVLKNFRLGLTFKGIFQDTTVEERLVPALDLGFYGKYPLSLPPFIFLLPSYIDLGVSLNNFNTYPEPDSANDPWLNLEIPSGIRVGSRMPVFFDGFYQSFFYKQSGELSEYGMGLEWFYNKRLSLSSSFMLDADPIETIANNISYKDSSRVNVGVGYKFDRLPSINFYPSRGRFDIAYSFLTNGKDKEIRFGLTLLGKAQDTVPVIESPKDGTRVSKDYITVTGEGEPNSTVTLFKNTIQARQVDVDVEGKWVVDQLSLNEGNNKIYAVSDSTNNESSESSDLINVIKDTEKPEVFFSVVRDNDKLLVKLKGQESLSSVSYQGDMGWEELERTSENEFQLSYPLERGLGSIFEDSLLIQLEDYAKNQHFITLNPLVVRLERPKDREILYVEKSLLTAKFSPLLKKLSINGEDIALSKTGGLISSLNLKPGKNLIYFDMVLYPENMMESTYRVLVIKRFSDIEANDENRQQLEILGTLGYILEKDENRFEPEAPLLRIDVVRWMANFLKLSIPNVSEDVFLDISKDYEYAAEIKAVVDEGVLLPFPDGTFRPNQALTVTQAYQIFRNLELLPPDRILISNDRITRRAFALIFTQLPSYAKDSTELFDWESGFN